MFSVQRILILTLCLLIGGKEVYASGVRIVDSVVKEKLENKHNDRYAQWAMPAEVAEECEETEQDDTADDAEFALVRKIELTSIETHERSLIEVRQIAINLHGSRLFLQLRNLRL